jgi:hypothetical protein
MLKDWRQIEARLKDRTAEMVAAAALLRLAADVLHLDSEGRSSWVATRALNAAMNWIVGAIDEGDDVNATDSTRAAVSLWLGLTAVEPTITAGPMAGQIDDPAVGTSVAFLQLRKAAEKLEYLNCEPVAA